MVSTWKTGKILKRLDQNSPSSPVKFFVVIYKLFKWTRWESKQRPTCKIFIKTIADNVNATCGVNMKTRVQTKPIASLVHCATQNSLQFILLFARFTRSQKKVFHHSPNLDHTKIAAVLTFFFEYRKCMETNVCCRSAPWAEPKWFVCCASCAAEKKIEIKIKTSCRIYIYKHFWWEAGIFFIVWPKLGFLKDTRTRNKPADKATAFCTW